MEYLAVKWVHVLSATLLFGTGLGSAFYKLMTDRTGNLQAIAQTNRIVVLADWLFTTPAVVVQPVTGVWLALAVGYPLSSSWIVLSVLLYVIAGLCWLPVVYLQIRMRDLAVAAAKEGRSLDHRYAQQARIWFWLGVPAFTAIVVVYYLMIFKPTIWV